MATRDTDKPPLWIAASDLSASPGHPFDGVEPDVASLWSWRSPVESGLNLFDEIQNRDLFVARRIESCRRGGGGRGGDRSRD